VSRVANEKTPFVSSSSKKEKEKLMGARTVSSFGQMHA
jgi:hypothetical protein